MKLILTLLTYSIFYFIEIHPISPIELWIHRVAIAVCLILFFLFFIGRRNSSSKINNISNTGDGENHKKRVSTSSLEFNMTELRNRIKILEDNVQKISGSNMNAFPNLDKDFQKNIPTQKETLIIKESVPENTEEVLSSEIELPVDRSHGNVNENNKKGHFYLTSPDKEKIFFAPEATSVPTERTLYSIEDDQLKLYDQIHDQTMRLALNSLDIVVKRACDIVNAREPQHSKIVMVEPGKVTKENEDFLVLSKMKVKFE